MLNGHGDDAFRYDRIDMNFSTNISQHADHTLLRYHLNAHFDLVANYPEPEAWTLEQLLARHLGVPPQCVVVTSGATDAIYLIAQTFSHLPYEVEQPTFSEYEDACHMFHLAQGPGGLCWVCNPRNPDGRVYQPDELDRLAHNHRLLIIDQAYELYTRHTLMTAAEAVERRNIIQLHSLTKTYAIPGLRLGYLVADSAITAVLRRNMRPWSVNALAIEAGRFLIEHDELIMRPDLDEAQRLWRLLSAIDGLHVLPTETNFMLCQLRRGSATDLKDRLARHYHMLIRDASNFRGLAPGHFRVAAQAREENDRLVNAIAEELSEIH